MKTTKASVFLLFIIFSVTPSSFLLGVANATNEPVLDTDGNEVQTGTEYYVVSAIWGAGGGGLALGRPSGNPCPEVVAQRRSGDDGIPVIFSSLDSNDGVVRLSSDINIEFVPLRPRLCRTTTVWKVDDYDHSAGKWWVITDGIKGNPGADTLTSWFRIEKGVFLVTNLSTAPQYVEHAQLYATKLGETQKEIWYVWLSPLTMDGHLSLRKKKVHFRGFNKLLGLD